MILSVGARTDITNYYSDWLLERLEEGHVYSRNPLFPNKITRYELDPKTIDCIVFCSKNYSKILPRIKEISDRFRIYCYYTITAYGKDVEPNVPSIEESIETLHKLSEIVGKKRVAWRYDPVLLTQKYSIDMHFKTFENMIEQIHNNAERCVFSFVEMYKKLNKNMPEIIPMTEADRDQLAKGLGSIAKKYNMKIQTCGTNGDYTQYEIERSGCVALDILGNANGCAFRNAIHKGMRKGCHCIENRDIGAYDTCPSGCRYCYANNDMKKVKENYKMHDKHSPLLIGQIKETDVVQQGVQKSLLVVNAPKDCQKSLEAFQHP